MSERVQIGRYVLCDALASGGMGTVHLATTDDGHGGKRVVAVKRLHPHHRNDEEFSMMLLDEARLAVSIHHPNVVQVLDVVSTPTDLLLVMEYVPGVSVYEAAIGIQGNRAAAPLDVAITMLVDALAGLQAAHEAVGDDGKPLNLVHRDVSPQNFIVDASTGTTKLTDFGVAKAAGRLRSTHDGSIRGKLAYMAPEHVAGDPLDARSDVYSAAVVLWGLVAGRNLFVGESDVALFGKAMRGATERLIEAEPRVPKAVDDVVWRALARDPRRRYPSALAFAEALVAAHGPIDRHAVANWVRVRAGFTISQRTTIVDRILAEDTATALTQQVIVEPAAAPATYRKKKTLQSLYPLYIGTALMAAVCAVYIGTRSRDLPAEASTPPADSLFPPAPPAPVQVASSDPTPAPSVVAAPDPQPSASSKPARRPSRKGDNPKADCNPPYTQDADGKHFKPWCLH